MRSLPSWRVGGGITDGFAAEHSLGRRLARTVLVLEETLSIGDLAVRLEQGSVVVVDVRPADEVVEGSIPGSWPVGITELPARLRDADDPLRRRLHRGVAVVALVAGDTDRYTSARSMFGEVGVGVVRVDGEVRGWSRAGRPMNRG